jgi:hypothetical protein
VNVDKSRTDEIVIARQVEHHVILLIPLEEFGTPRLLCGPNTDLWGVVEGLQDAALQIAKGIAQGLTD